MAKIGGLRPKKVGSRASGLVSREIKGKGAVQKQLPAYKNKGRGPGLGGATVAPGAGTATAKTPSSGPIVKNPRIASASGASGMAKGASGGGGIQNMPFALQALHKRLEEKGVDLKNPKVRAKAKEELEQQFKNSKKKGRKTLQGKIAGRGGLNSVVKKTVEKKLAGMK